MDQKIAEIKAKLEAGHGISPDEKALLDTEIEEEDDEVEEPSPLTQVVDIRRMIEEAGLTDKIAAWKKEFHPISIEASVVDGGLWIYRGLRRSEFRTVKPDMPGADDRVCKLAILYPSNFDLEALPAGIPVHIASQVGALSGFQPDAAPLRL